MIQSLLKSLFLTLIIELLAAIAFGIRNKEDVKVIICANLCTNPVVVYVSNCILLLNNMFLYFVIAILLEIIVVITEFIIYKKCLTFDKISPFIISFVSNVISFGTGIIITIIK